MALAEEQADHRRTIESHVIAQKIAAERRGQILGFTLVVLVTGIGAFLLCRGQDVSGLMTLITALASVVGIFVYGRRKEAEERREKRRDFAPSAARPPSFGEADS